MVLFLSIYMTNLVKIIPEKYLNKFTLNNRIPIYTFLFDDITNNEIIWSNDIINEILFYYTKERILNNTHKLLSIWKDRGEPYPDHRIGGGCLLLQKALNKYTINNKNIAVIGSKMPWIECICLNNQANKVTTVEYNIPICNYPNIDILEYYSEFKENKNNHNKFDGIISYSSIEHSGLGRYGDSIDPDGDLKTMDDIYNSLKDDGLLYLGIPVGKDALCWNAHRIYGTIRLTLLLKKFKILEWFGCSFEDSQRLPKGHDWKSFYQPIIVLQKII